ncbi:MAG: DUF1570 domain-containing protein [Planctomycetota bacterium]|jgi:hypothetical protein
MRIAILSLLLAAGAFRLVTPPVDETEAGPPIEIRLDGGGDAAMERKIEGILDRYPAMKRHRTTRFELLSDLPDEESARHGRLLERTAHAVDDFCETLGLERDDSERDRRRLVIAFASRTEFMGFAGWSDQVHARWLAGYFSPKGGHMVYHHASDNPSVRDATNRLARHRSGGGDVDRGQLDAIEMFSDHATASVVIHEAVHLLLHEQGALTASTENPIWLVEGIAGSFEPRVVTERFGPSRPENGRTEEFRRQLAAGRVPSIASMIEARAVPDGESSRAAFYDAAATLCSWLVRHEPAGMARYFARPNAVSATPEMGRHVAFEQAFGPVASIQRRWLDAERTAAGLPRP